MKSRNRGYTQLETLLMVLVVGLVIFIGWYVYHNNHKSTSATKSSSQTVNAPTPPAALQAAKSFTQKVYDSYLAAWGTKSESDFINANKTYFSSDFLANMSKNNGPYLLCGDTSKKPDSFKTDYGSIAKDNKTAQIWVNSQFKNSAPPADYKATYVNLTASGSSWVVNSKICPTPTPPVTLPPNATPPKTQ